jgi:hypothetical protein
VACEALAAASAAGSINAARAALPPRRTGPAVWLGPQLAAKPQEWTIELSAADVAEVRCLGPGVRVFRAAAMQARKQEATQPRSRAII